MSQHLSVRPCRCRILQSSANLLAASRTVRIVCFHLGTQQTLDCPTEKHANSIEQPLFPRPRNHDFHRVDVPNVSSRRHPRHWSAGSGCGTDLNQQTVGSYQHSTTSKSASLRSILGMWRFFLSIMKGMKVTAWKLFHWLDRRFMLFLCGKYDISSWLGLAQDKLRKQYAKVAQWDITITSSLKKLQTSCSAFDGPQGLW